MEAILPPRAPVDRSPVAAAPPGGRFIPTGRSRRPRGPHAGDGGRRSGSDREAGAKAPPAPSDDTETARQRLLRWLRERPCDFEELRSAIGLSPRALESELRHVEQSLRHGGERLEVEGPVCRDCGFAFPGRRRRHLHPPGRCPRCRGSRVEGPSLAIR